MKKALFIEKDDDLLGRCFWLYYNSSPFFGKRRKATYNFKKDQCWNEIHNKVIEVFDIKYESLSLVKTTSGFVIVIEE